MSRVVRESPDNPISLSTPNNISSLTRAMPQTIFSRPESLFCVLRAVVRLQKVACGAFCALAKGATFASLVLCAAVLMTSSCGNSVGSAGHAGAIHLIVEHRLLRALDSSLKQFESDLRSEGYSVSIDGSMEASTSPREIRQALQKRWNGTPKLRGAILIGEFSAPLFNNRSQQGDAYWHDHLIDLFYMDLNGVFVDTDNDGVLDAHRSFEGGKWARLWSAIGKRAGLGLDRRAPEIWVSRIRAGTLAPLADEMTLYRDYFMRNHAYRTGTGPKVPPRAFVVASSAKFTESDWGTRPRKLYSDVAVSECVPNASVLSRQYLSDPKGWALAVVGSFSGPQVHKFSYYEGGGIDEGWFRTREGHQLLAQYSLLDNKPWDLTSRDIAQIKPNVLFYQVLSSETGRHDVPGYLAGAYLFFGSGLAVIAGTQHSGAVGVSRLYDNLAKKESLGEAWREAMEWSLDHGGRNLKLKWCDKDEPWDPSIDPYKAVLLGDGTLHLPAAK